MTDGVSSLKQLQGSVNQYGNDCKSLRPIRANKKAKNASERSDGWRTTDRFQEATEQKVNETSPPLSAPPVRDIWL